MCNAKLYTVKHILEFEIFEWSWITLNWISKTRLWALMNSVVVGCPRAQFWNCVLEGWKFFPVRHLFIFSYVRKWDFAVLRVVQTSVKILIEISNPIVIQSVVIQPVVIQWSNDKTVAHVYYKPIKKCQNPHNFHKSSKSENTVKMEYV